MAQSFHATWHKYQYFYKVQGPIPIFLQSTGTNTNSFVFFFFNRKLTEGPIPILLQSAGTNFKQKKVQGPMPKPDESARTKDIFKPSVYGSYSVR
jgi:hypothetical protein